MATIKDIAKATGLSAMTISRYFNSPEKVKASTSAKIKKAVEELDYSPNLMARLLVTKRTNIICIYIAGDIGVRHPFTTEFVMGIGERLGENNYSIQICRDDYKSKSCDGIVAMGADIQEEEDLMKMSDVKAIILFGNSSKQSNWVDINNYNGMRTMASYVVERGYKRIGYIGTCWDMRYSRDRYHGFSDVMQEKGIAVKDKDVIHVVHNDEWRGYEAAKQIVENGNVEILVCASDALAIGAMRYANENNISIPEQLSITGFDGLGYEKLVTPNITTIAQPVYEAGKILADRIMEVLKTGEYGDKTEMYIEPVLMVNGSTK